MPRIPAHTLDDAPEQTRPTLETLSKRMGKLLNIHGGMAHSPVVLATYAAMQETIARLGTFDGKTRPCSRARGDRRGGSAVQDDTWKQAQSAGCSDEELTEAFAHIGANLYTTSTVTTRQQNDLLTPRPAATSSIRWPWRTVPPP